MLGFLAKIGTAANVLKWGAALVGLEYVRESAKPEGGVVKDMVDGAIKIGTPAAKEVAGQLIQGAQNLGAAGFEGAKDAVTSVAPNLSQVPAATAETFREAGAAVGETAEAAKDGTQGFMEGLVGKKYAGMATAAVGLMGGGALLSFFGGAKGDRNMIGKLVDKTVEAPGNFMGVIAEKLGGLLMGTVALGAAAVGIWALATGRLGGIFNTVMEKLGFGQGQEGPSPEATPAAPAPSAPSHSAEPTTPNAPLLANEELRRAGDSLARNSSNVENANSVAAVAPTVLPDTISQPSRNAGNVSATLAS